MRIAVFIKNTTLHESYGGLETQNFVLCKGLASRGHDVVVFAPKREFTQETAEEDGIKYVFVDCKYKMGWVLGFFGHLDKKNWVNRSVDEFSKEHSSRKFDVILGQSSTAVGLIRRKENHKVPIISIAHGSILSEYKTYLLEINSIVGLLKLIPNTGFALKNFFTRQREMVHGSNKVIAVSSYVKNRLVEETFTTVDHITTVHNGIDPSNINKRDWDKSNPPIQITYVGRMERSKGVHLLIDAMCAKHLANAHLNLVGDGPYKLSLQVVANKLNLDSQVSFLGWLKSKEVLEMMSKSDIFVLPTLRIEGFPMTLVEAMFAGLPIVAADMGGISDAVCPEETGYLVESGNLEVLKDKLISLVSNKELRRQYGDAALKRANENYTVDVMIDKYMDVISEVIK